MQRYSPTVRRHLTVSNIICHCILLHCLSLLACLPALNAAPAESAESAAPAASLSEPHPPLGARWHMSLQQVEQLQSLDRTADGALRNTHRVSANTETELVAYWQGRIVTFLFAEDFGLYAVGIEMVPWLTQHTISETDLELRDLKYNAPIRVAIATKYGFPQGVGVLWSAEEVISLAESRISTKPYSAEGLINWDYGTSWLVWQGGTTRLALSDQSVWYASREGLAHRLQVERAGEQDAFSEDENETQQEAARQRNLDQQRQGAVSRAADFEAIF